MLKLKATSSFSSPQRKISRPGDGARGYRHPLISMGSLFDGFPDAQNDYRVVQQAYLQLIGSYLTRPHS